jgi:hypothetical protein
MCGEWKPQEAFAFRNKATGRRQSHCRICHAAYRRRHYLENRQLYIDREVARIAARRVENHVRIREHLLANPCVDCGERDVVLLEFDHRDPATKRLDVASLAVSHTWRVVLEEIRKCDVRCVSCHRKRTATQFKWTKGLVRQLALLTPALLTDRDTAAERISESESRLCTRCRSTKPLREFGFRNRAKGTRKTRCRACVAEVSRRHYEQHRSAYKRRARKNRRAQRERVRSRLLAYLLANRCVDCGEDDPVLLEFDHRDRASKVATVGALARRGTWRAVEREIEKCDVRCVRCHRRRTATQFGWSRLTVA